MASLSLFIFPLACTALLEAASSTRRTTAEQFLTVELMIETAPLSSFAYMTPPCGCEECAG